MILVRRKINRDFTALPELAGASYRAWMFAGQDGPPGDEPWVRAHAFCGTGAAPMSPAESSGSP